MKFLTFFVFLAAVWAQAPSTPPPDLPDETVVATFDDGVKLTMGEFKRIYAVLPPENQPQAISDRAAFLKQWALMRKLAKMAEEEHLDKLSPSKEALEYYRFLILSQAKMNAAVKETAVMPSDVQSYYETNKDQFKQIRVKAIYIGFGGAKLTEDGAKSKAAKLVEQARAGADFAKLARENSDDETSRASAGDFAVFRVTDTMPDAVRAAVFGLSHGQISDPIRQSNGYYIFRAEEVSFRPFPEVRDDIFTQLKQKRYGEWLSKTNGDSIVLFNPLFIGATPLQMTPVPVSPKK